MGRDYQPRVPQKRVVLFAYDGAGLGHLRRLSRIAAALQGPCACLVITGHRAADWIVPASCEYVHLPSLDSLLPHRSAIWGRTPFLRLDGASAKRLRQNMLEAMLSAFAPDALIVDYLPFGKDDETLSFIQSTQIPVYFIIRGILDSPKDVQDEILFEPGSLKRQLIESRFARILVTCDRRICDVDASYGFGPNLAPKIRYVGYVHKPVSADVIARVRAARGLREGDRWLVCTGGGGRKTEPLYRACLELVSSLPGNLHCDVIAGPRSAAAWPYPEMASFVEGRTRYWRACQQLDVMHAAADVVVAAGGYNTLMECLAGRARVVCVPMEGNLIEPHEHSQRLSAYHPIRVTTLDQLLPTVQSAIEGAADWRVSPAHPLALDGLAEIRKILFDDFGLPTAGA